MTLVKGCHGMLFQGQTSTSLKDLELRTVLKAEGGRTQGTKGTKIKGIMVDVDLPPIKVNLGSLILRSKTFWLRSKS